MGLAFEWDSAKATGNLAKHGVSFEEAASAFADPLSLSMSDPDHSVGEERWLLLGVSASGRLVVVAHTERGDRIRLISARLVARLERQQYEGDT